MVIRLDWVRHGPTTGSSVPPQIRRTCYMCPGLGSSAIPRPAQRRQDHWEGHWRRRCLLGAASVAGVQAPGASSVLFLAAPISFLAPGAGCFHAFPMFFDEACACVFVVAGGASSVSKWWFIWNPVTAPCSRRAPLIWTVQGACRSCVGC